MTSKIILIGGSGFIGKKLSIFLKNQNLDCISTNSKELNLLDDNNSVKIKELSQNRNSTFIFLSALTPDKGKDINTFNLNIKMADLFLKNFDEENVESNHMIYISSDAVYPLFLENIDQESLPTPTDLYSSMHLTREIMFKSKFGKNLTILRPTLIYGFGDTHNSYGPNRFFKQMIEKNEIDIFGEGSDMRDHLYINDFFGIFHI